MSSAWVRREHSKSTIRRAGEQLTAWWVGGANSGRFDHATFETIDAIEVAQNWRTCHAYPLNAFQVTLRQRARRVEHRPLIAQRLKRFVSVVEKLAREVNMNLAQMQDLGGCRAVLSSVDAVDRLAALYGFGQANLFAQEDASWKDYIREPKPDGYRGIHIVGRFAPKTRSGWDWNGQRVEIQLRTRLQHAFSTAVETVTTFTNQPLKFGGGPEDWRRFFALMGSMLAVREGTQLVPGTSADPHEIALELWDLTQALNVPRRLRSWAEALRSMRGLNIKDAQWLLLALDVETSTVRVQGFQAYDVAAKTLGQLEKGPRGQTVDAVLVRLTSARQLRAAYPNYYADTTQFLEALGDALALVKRR